MELTAVLVVLLWLLHLAVVSCCFAWRMNYCSTAGFVGSSGFAADFMVPGTY